VSRLCHTIAICSFIISLLFLDSTVIVDKDKGAFVFGIDVTLGSLVTRAQVALGIVVGQSSLGWALLLSSVQGKFFQWLVARSAKQLSA
jgi:phosphoglycerol transferase MdoB-like AlkP superfamily enzyme